MKHNREALIAADYAVLHSLKAFGADAVVEQVADDSALSELMDQNVRGALISAMGRDDKLHTVIKTAMLYGFLWGHRVASDARNHTAAANMGG